MKISQNFVAFLDMNFNDLRLFLAKSWSVIILSHFQSLQIFAKKNLKSLFAYPKYIIWGISAGVKIYPRLFATHFSQFSCHHSIKRGDGNSPIASTYKLLANSLILVGISWVSSSTSGEEWSIPNLRISGTFIGIDLASIDTFSPELGRFLYAASGKPEKRDPTIKGQLISKGLYDVIVLTKKKPKFL